MASVSQQYVEQYAEFAIEQQRKYGVPASVTLAQGILESANGRSQLSRECNNHFGIKAGPGLMPAVSTGSIPMTDLMKSSANIPRSATATSITP